MATTSFSTAIEANCEALGNVKKAGFAAKSRRPLKSGTETGPCSRLPRGRFSLYILASYIFLFGVLHMLKGSSEPAMILLSICTVVQLALCVFRLHDINASGWWLLICLFIPLPFVAIFLCIKRGVKGHNRFGGDPLVTPSSA